MLIHQPMWVPLKYRDDFSRTAGSLGPDWDANVLPGNPNAQLNNDKAVGGQIASNTSRQACSWVRNAFAFETDNYYVRAQLAAPTDLAQNNYFSIWLGGANSFTTGRWMSYNVADDGAYLTRQRGTPNGAGQSATGGSNQDQMGGGLFSVGAGDMIELRRENDVFTTFKNGSQHLTPVTDTSCYRGEGNRRWGFTIEGNYPFLQKRYWSFWLEWIEAGDIV